MEIHFQSLERCMPNSAQWLTLNGFFQSWVRVRGILSLFAVDPSVFCEIVRESMGKRPGVAAHAHNPSNYSSRGRKIISPRSALAT